MGIEVSCDGHRRMAQSRLRAVRRSCAAGTVAILVIVFGWIMLALVPVVVAICWARVTLQDHTGGQVIAGAAVGTLVAAGVMSALA